MCHLKNWHSFLPFAPKTCNTKDMKNETILPSEAILKILAAALAERLNEVMIDHCAGLIMETTADVVTETLGVGFDSDGEIMQYIAMELSTRIAFVAV